MDGVQDPHLQLGTGSWDFGFGLAGAHRLEWGSLYASALYRENLRGSLGYRYGDVVLANLTLETPLSHFVGDPVFAALTPGVELNFRFAEKDQSHGANYQDSGGSLLLATPTLRIRLPWFAGQRPPFVRLAVQLPLTQTWLNGQQHEGPGVVGGPRHGVLKMKLAAAPRLRGVALGLLGAGPPPPIELRTLAGARVRITHGPGEPDVVLHFWATWCPECAEELPSLAPRGAGVRSRARARARGERRRRRRSS